MKWGDTPMPGILGDEPDSKTDKIRTIERAIRAVGMPVIALAVSRFLTYYATTPQDIEQAADEAARLGVAVFNARERGELPR